MSTMSAMASSALSGSSLHNYNNAVGISVTAETTDQQLQAPRRAVTPPAITDSKENETGDVVSVAVVSKDNDNDSDIEEDLEFIHKFYGYNISSSDEESDNDDTTATATVTTTTTTAPPMRTGTSPPTIPAFGVPVEFGAGKYDYDGTRQPRRSSLKQPNTTNSNKYTIDNNRRKSSNSINNGSNNSDSDNKGQTSPVARGVGRNKSADGIVDTRTVHSVRMRGSIYPVTRRRSIEFEEQVRIQEVTPTMELNDYNVRELWLQADEVADMKHRRRNQVKTYMEREAQMEKEAQKKLKEEEDRERRQRRQQREYLDQEKKNHLQNNNNNNKLLNKLPPKMKNSKFLTAMTTSLSSMSAHNKTATTSNSASNPASNSASTSTGGGNRRKQNRRLSWSAVIKMPDLSLRSTSPVPSVGRNKLSSPTTSSPTLSPQGRASSSSYSSSAGTTSSSFTSTNSIGSSNSNSDADSFRGLEKYIDRSGRKQKNMIWDAVLIEQDEQEQFGYYDEEKIAELYSKVQNQHNGQQKVLDRAKQDRKAADDYLMTPRTMKLMKTTIDVVAISSNIMDVDVDVDVDIVQPQLQQHDNSNDNNNNDNGSAAVNDDDESAVARSGGGVIRSHRMYMRRLSV